VSVLRAELFFFLIDVCSTASHVVCLTYCLLDSDGPLLLLRDWELASSGVIVWLATMFLRWTGVKGYLSDLVLKSCGPIAFDSRSGVSSLIQVWFWAFLVFLRWTGGCAVVEAE
jgi:hypothetical protein